MTHLVQQDITANQMVKMVHLTFKNGLLGAPPHLKILVSKLSENVTLKIPLCSSLTTPLLLPLNGPPLLDCGIVRFASFAFHVFLPRSLAQIL